MIQWEALTWPCEVLGEALTALAQAVGLEPRSMQPFAGVAFADARERTAWIEESSAALGFEALPVEVRYAEVAGALSALGPALVLVPFADDRAPRVLVVASSSQRVLRILTPAHRRASLDVEALRERLSAPLEESWRPTVDRWLRVASIAGQRAGRARRALLGEFLADRRIEGLWIVRPDPGAPLGRHWRWMRAPTRASVFLAASLAQVTAGLAAWVLLGRGALDGQVEAGWLLGWFLLVVSGVALQLVAGAAGGRLGLDVAAFFKARLLCGALRVEPGTIRTRGSGALLAMVSESEAFENAGLAGLLGGLAGAVQLLSSMPVLLAGTQGALEATLLAAWSALVVAVGVRYARLRSTWTRERFVLASSFVENVVGNRTRVVQQAPSERHRDEDALVQRYVAAGHAMDGADARLAALPARGWLVTSFAGLVPALLSEHVDTTGVALTIGGALQAQAGFAGLMTALPGLVAAGVAWRHIGPLFHAARLREPSGIPSAVRALPPLAASSSDETIIDMRRVTFAYPEAPKPVLRDCDLRVFSGEHLLIEGVSGGGKSTLAAILTGMQAARSGHVLLRGLDRATIGGAAWRRRVAGAPQFHENHVLTGSLAFNLLLGRSWPPSEDDRREAEALCRELGLGPLIDRMPCGLNQIIGETGWQLSHGERSRVFLARALLQRADAVLLDESLGSLDPITLRRCLDVVRRRARTLVVVAHP
jgi:ATP-binding cassette subfamily B protein